MEATEQCCFSRLVNGALIRWLLAKSQAACGFEADLHCRVREQMQKLCRIIVAR